MPFLRRRDEEKRAVQKREAEMEVQGVRRFVRPHHRQHHQALRAFPAMAFLQGGSIRDGLLPIEIQKAHGRVLEHMAYSALHRRDLRRCLFRWHLDHAAHRRANREHPRARARVASRAKRELGSLGGAHAADPSPYHGGLRRIARPRQGRAHRMAQDTNVAFSTSSGR